jgi:hypothetical protein
MSSSTDGIAHERVPSGKVHSDLGHPGRRIGHERPSRRRAVQSAIVRA